MASVLSFKKQYDDAFDPETTHLIGEAFDSACKSLSICPTPDVREAIAVRIVDAAASGERDLARLIEAGSRPWRKPR